VAGHRRLHAAAQGDAVDRGDSAGLSIGLDLAECQMRVVRQRQRLVEGVHVLVELADVRAGDEGRGALAGEHHRLDVFAPRHVIDDDVQSVVVRAR
jgi:hypothetical protein